MIFMGRLASEVAFIQLPTVIIIAAPEHAINTENNSVCITEQVSSLLIFVPLLMLHIVTVYCPVKYSAIGSMPTQNTVAATNKTTKSVGVIAVLSNADISTLKAIKQASKMLVKKLGFIEIRRSTFPNTSQKH